MSTSPYETYEPCATAGPRETYDPSRPATAVLHATYDPPRPVDGITAAYGVTEAGGTIGSPGYPRPSGTIGELRCTETGKIFGAHRCTEADETFGVHGRTEADETFGAHRRTEADGAGEIGARPVWTPHGDTYRPAYELAGPALSRQTSGSGAGARRGVRRRRARYPGRPETGMRRLLPQALVVAFLAGGTTAFVAKDKAIELSVDGRPRTLHTFADDVTGLLADEGVPLGTHDAVAPAPGTALSSGDDVTVRHGRPVRLTLDGRRSEQWTTARTVEEALRQWGVRVEGAYLSAARSQPIGRAGLTLDVRTERSVTVMADGRAGTVRTNAATVAEAVAAAGVTLHGQDTTSVPPESFPRDGQTVTVLRITGGREVREEPIPFVVRRIADPTLFQGTEVVERAGQSGIRRVTYALRTVNGVRQRPRRVGSEVARAPRAQVVKVGTRPHPPSVRGADHLNWRGLAQCESGGRPDAVDPSGTYGGLYQFDRGTWHGLGGQGRPQDAPAAEQTYRAKKLYVRRGTSPWPQCGGRLTS
ncbi:ubiquitin-like domain-containing protein [Streptomyces sp. NPDC015220]|uniref:ubiquitin-like domain-containing protein n=1 Tax=Streptomyces sp. NPDC015220 TaxID=3364947 RepID=UPI0036F778A3